MRTVNRWRCFVAGLVLFSGGVIFADSKPDLSSPKKAATAFAVGLQAGDYDQVKASTVGEDADYKLMLSVSSTMQAVHRLHDAAVARFGAENAKKLETGVNENKEIARQIEASDEKLTGDTATILEKGKPDSSTVYLKRVNGDWKVDLTHYPQKQIMQQSLPMLDAMRTVMTQSAADVTSGHYKTVEDAATDVRQRMYAMQAAIVRQQAPQTAPAK